MAAGVARDLAGVLSGGLRDGTAADIEAIGLLVAVHWIRCQLLPEGQGQDDLKACLAWSAVLLPTAPDLVPEPVQTRLTGVDTWAKTSNDGARTEALFKEYERTWDIDHLHAAITVGQEAVEATPPDHPDRPAVLSMLGGVLQTRFGRTGQVQDLDQAVAVGREAVEATPSGHPDRPGYLSNLGMALRTQFGRTGQVQDLDQAVAVGQEAVEATPPGHADRPAMLSNLGGALQTRFDRTAQTQDLDQAITVGWEAVEATPPVHPTRPGYLSNLGMALLARFERTGQLQDLDQAITVGREAVERTLPDHPTRPAYLSNLGGALRTRFGRTGQLQDLDQAITVGWEAAEATRPDHPTRPGTLSNLGIALRTRFERTGQQQDLDQAITVGQEAVSATPPDHPSRPVMLSMLGGALQTQFGRTGQLQDLDWAITVGQEAVSATPTDHPDRPGRLSNLGLALRTRFERTRQQQDLDAAIEVYREASGVVTASPGLRLTAARDWGRSLVLAGRGAASVEAYEVAVALLPLVVWHGLDRQTLEHHLRVSAGLASEAAAAAVAAGDPRRAVELAEAARAMLWTQALHLRQDLTAVQHHTPQLAAALKRARTVLDRAPGSADDPDLSVAGHQGRAQTAEQQMLQARRQAASDWDTAVQQVRQLDGFQHFLQPVPFAELRPAAAEGPVVIVNVSRHGSHALIITSPTAPAPQQAVRVVNLPTATLDAVIDQANILLGARSRAGDPDADWETREDDRHAVFDVLAWTWHAITEPILVNLGYTTTPPGPVEDWPRVWWCPTGPAAVLPLHAAGIHPRTALQYTAMGPAAAAAQSVAGRVVPSYTPTLTALARARARPTPGPVRSLAVGVPHAPSYATGAGALPSVLPELRAAAGHLPPPDQATHLTGPTATRDQVLHSLPGHSWLHLSCHGVQHPVDASLSAFLLHDQPLTLADLAALNLPAADLAYLAACQTATGDVNLLDEALHLAAALQSVGYRHVLATLWSISDTAAPAMAHTIYAHLTHPNPHHPTAGDHPDADRAPYALHHAITHLRQTRPSEPLTWAPYIHLGP